MYSDTFHHLNRLLKLSVLYRGKVSVQMALSFSNQITVKGRENEKKAESKQRLTRKVTLAKGDSQEIAFHRGNKAQLGWMLAPRSWLDFQSAQTRRKLEVSISDFLPPFFGGKDLDKDSGRQGWRTEGMEGHMQRSGARRQIGWLDWFSDLVLQLELVQELQMRQIKGPWWQLGVGALCSSGRWVVLDKLICPWRPWNRPAFIRGTEEPLSIWCPAAEPHKDLKLISKAGTSDLWLKKRKLPSQWQHYDVRWINSQRCNMSIWI